MISKAIESFSTLTFFLVVVSAKEIKNEKTSVFHFNSWMAENYERCQTVLCVPKCCPIGQYGFGFGEKCFQTKNIRKDFHDVPLYHNNLTKSGRYLNDVVFIPGRFLDPDFVKTAVGYTFDPIPHNHYITEDGKLYDETPNTVNRWNIYDKNQFCVEYFLPMPKLKRKQPILKFYISIPTVSATLEEIDTFKEKLFISGYLISSFFLALVLVVYGLLRELRNLAGKVLMAYVAALLFTFILRVTIVLARPTRTGCKFFTYCIHFLLLSGFCWMNVMSCDIWWTFRGFGRARPIRNRGENFKFCMYCCYGFGLPAAMNIAMIILNETDMRHIPWFVTPNILRKSCFISAHEKLYYLNIPTMILVVCNWIFFLMTAINICRMHRDTAVLDTAAAGTPAAHRSQKFRFFLYLKLSVIMGIYWVLQVTGFFNIDSEGWELSDIYNILIGFTLFLIFVCKKKILQKLYKRLKQTKGASPVVIQI